MNLKLMINLIALLVVPQAIAQSRRTIPEPAAKVLERQSPPIKGAEVVSILKGGLIVNAYKDDRTQFRAFIFTRTPPKDGKYWSGLAKPLGKNFIYTNAAGEKMVIPAYDAGEFAKPAK